MLVSLERLLSCMIFRWGKLKLFTADSLTQCAGDKQRFFERPYEHRHFVFPLTLDAAAEGTLLIRTRTSGSVQLPIVLWAPEAFSTSDQYALLALGLFYGILLGLADWIGKETRVFEDMGWRDGLIVGMAQALAIIPGTSRSAHACP